MAIQQRKRLELVRDSDNDLSSEAAWETSDPRLIQVIEEADTQWFAIEAEARLQAYDQHIAGESARLAMQENARTRVYGDALLSGIDRKAKPELARAIEASNARIADLGLEHQLKIMEAGARNRGRTRSHALYAPRALPEPTPEPEPVLAPKRDKGNRFIRAGKILVFGDDE